MAGKIYVATESFTTELDGVSVSVARGVTRVREGHPLLAGRESMFAELDVHYELEEATAEPGAKRGARAPRDSRSTT